MQSLHKIRRSMIFGSLLTAGLGNTVLAQKTEATQHEKETAPIRLEPLIEKAIAARNFKNKRRKLATEKLYLTNAYKPVWTSGLSWFDYTHVAHSLMGESANEGLIPVHYLPAHLGVLPNLAKLPPTALAEADVALSDGFAAFLDDLIDGRIPGTENTEKSERKEPAFYADQALRSGNIEHWVRLHGPNNRQYVALREAMQRLESDDPKRLLLAINMERWRKDQEYFAAQKLVKINLPTFHLETWNGFLPLFDMPVVVGKPGRPTPVLPFDQITSLKFSPDWGVPATIEREDIIPILQKKPEIFEKMGLEVLKDGKHINAHEVDWNRVDPEHNVYSFRQPPGKENALGGVRFSLTNKFDIYLHDSPDRTKFSEPERAFSSGCVRVGNAEKLATWIMDKNHNWNRKRVRTLMDSGKTHIQRLEQAVDVTFTYYSAWAKPDNTILYGRDIYGFDQAIADKIDFGQSLSHPELTWSPPQQTSEEDSPILTP